MDPDPRQLVESNTSSTGAYRSIPVTLGANRRRHAPGGEQVLRDPRSRSRRVRAELAAVDQYLGQGFVGLGEPDPVGDQSTEE